MCFQYEDLYPGYCWDFMESGLAWVDTVEEGSLPAFLGRFYGIAVADRPGFTEAVFRLFAELHESGVIRPSLEEAPIHETPL